MAARKQWSDLSERTRRLLITVAVVEGVLKVAALIDIKDRPVSQIRLIPPVVAEGWSAERRPTDGASRQRYTLGLRGAGT